MTARPRAFLGLALGAALLAGCAGAKVPAAGGGLSPYPIARAPAPGDIVHLPTGLLLDFERMMDIVEAAKVIYVGEMHSNFQAHEAQRRLIEGLRFGGQESIIAFNLRSILCVPLKVKSELIGVIYTDNRIRTGIFSESDRDLLLAFADQAAVSIENARLFSSLKRTLEEVTELKNLMDDVFASIVSGVITADVQDQITLCNRAAAAILGNTSAEIVGRSIEEILPTFAGDILPHLESVRRTEQPIVGLEFSHNLPDRGYVDWRFNGHRLRAGLIATQAPGDGGIQMKGLRT